MSNKSQVNIFVMNAEGEIYQPMFIANTAQLERDVQKVWDGAIEFAYTNDDPKPLTMTIAPTN